MFTLRMGQRMQICQSDHLVHHRGLIQTSKWRQQTAYHCNSCVSLLCPTADSALAGLASEMIYTGGEECTVSSTPTSALPSFSSAEAEEKKHYLRPSPLVIALNGTVSPQRCFQQGTKEPCLFRLINQNLPVLSEGIMQLFCKTALWTVSPACIATGPTCHFPLLNFMNFLTSRFSIP